MPSLNQEINVFCNDGPNTETDATELLMSVIPLKLSGLTSFADFADGFPYAGDGLYSTVHQRHPGIVKIKKERVAVRHLQKVFEATFSISSHIGFYEMSVRDLCQETGISMGSMYSCINKKEDIAVMVMDMVELISKQVIDVGQQQANDWQRLSVTIQQHLYSSHLLQSWFFFLYFETRCLPLEKQKQSKAIELQAIDNYALIIQQGIKAGLFKVDGKRNNIDFVANTVLVMLQDSYLKPWKSKQYHVDIEQYFQNLIAMIAKLVNYDGETL